MIKSFEDLEVWRRAHALVLDVYRVTNHFPKNEQFGIVSQLRRAAYSIPANIAEGFGRRTTRELLQVLAISNGSLEEARYFLMLSRDLRYLPPVEYQRFDGELKRIAEMLGGLSRSLKNRAARLVSRSEGKTRATDHETRDTTQRAEN